MLTVADLRYKNEVYTRIVFFLRLQCNSLSRKTPHRTRVDTQKDGSCPRPRQSVDFFYPLKKPHSFLAIGLPVSQTVAYTIRSHFIRSGVLPGM